MYSIGVLTWKHDIGFFEDLLWSWCRVCFERYYTNVSPCTKLLSMELLLNCLLGIWGLITVEMYRSDMRLAPSPPACG
ncbi:hypothetical protein EJ08DRAFT_235549 [Tothia fuscella]|uniref:Uncharacterized protein n=1 Tax=Tothia fuscella TaxID=1048955 RepID=A0A9P4TZ35_9PEZI|nr:hypothetical protein EJ08DRAFT_235549 [Tothia fuscella]